MQPDELNGAQHETKLYNPVFLENPNVGGDELGGHEGHQTVQPERDIVHHPIPVGFGVRRNVFTALDELFPANFGKVEHGDREGHNAHEHQGEGEREQEDVLFKGIAKRHSNDGVFIDSENITFGASDKEQESRKKGLC